MAENLVPMFTSLRTAAEFAEPIRHVVGSPRLLVPFGRGNTLDSPRAPLPAGRVETVPGVGELFFRDTGPASHGPRRGTLVLMHGWMVPSDPHWFRTFGVLHREGWRVVALDARGHGRGLRSTARFRLTDCAHDAAALIDHLDCGPVTVVGYSMGGIIAQLLARDEPDLLDGVVLCATGCEFRTSLIMRSVWSSMGVLQLAWRLAPHRFWAALASVMAYTEQETADWLVGELSRGAPWDIAEAGREIGRFDSRPWLAEIAVPTAVVVTTADLLVPPDRQRDLARRLDASTVELVADHLAPATAPRHFHRALLSALDRLEEAPIELGAQSRRRRAQGPAAG